MTSSEHSVGRKVVDRISQHLAPNGVGFVEDFRDFLGREHELIKLLLGLVASESSEEFSSMGDVGRSFPFCMVEIDARWMVEARHVGRIMLVHGEELFGWVVV